jgi:integrase
MISALPNKRTKDTVDVYVRHAADCKKKNRGRFYRDCDCNKYLYIYRNGMKEERSAKTRSWAEAEKRQTEVLDSWDPVKVQAAHVKASQEKRLVTIEDALRRFIKEMLFVKRSSGTMRQTTAALGDPDAVRTGSWIGRTPRNTNLWKWVGSYNRNKPVAQRLTYLAQLDADILREWRETWVLGDRSAQGYWTRLSVFFNWCVRQRWITENPTHFVTPVKLKKGSRTTVFTDAQYDSIVEATNKYQKFPREYYSDEVARLRVRAFIELMRWTGMAISDVILFKPELIDDGVLMYRRRKNGNLGVVPVPVRVQQLIHQLPAAHDTASGYLFRSTGSIERDVLNWEKRLGRVFEAAGIETVRTEIRERKPHPHMLRDTFAVWYINRDVPLEEVAKMLGHANSKITEECYLPWVQSRQHKMVSRVREILGEGSGTVVNIHNARDQQKKKARAALAV